MLPARCWPLCGARSTCNPVACQDCCVTAGSVSGVRDMPTQQLQAFVARFSLSIFLNVEAHLSDVLAEWLVG